MAQAAAEYTGSIAQLCTRPKTRISHRRTSHQMAAVMLSKPSHTWIFRVRAIFQIRQGKQTMMEKIINDHQGQEDVSAVVVHEIVRMSREPVDNALRVDDYRQVAELAAEAEDMAVPSILRSTLIHRWSWQNAAPQDQSGKVATSPPKIDLSRTNPWQKEVAQHSHVPARSRSFPNRWPHHLIKINNSLHHNSKARANNPRLQKRPPSLTKARKVRARRCQQWIRSPPASLQTHNCYNRF